MPNDKPNFSSWEVAKLEKLAHELWDANSKLHEANEQLRMDNKDLSKINRELLTKEKL